MKKTTQTEIAKPAVDLTAKRDAEVIPAALEIFCRIAGRADLEVGDSVTLNIDQLANYYQKVYREEVIPTLLTSNIQLSAIKYLFEMTQVPIDRLQEAFNGAESDAEAIAIAKRIFAVLSTHKDLPTGAYDKPTVAEYYKKLWDEEIKPILANAKWGAVSYLFQLLRQPFQVLSDLTVSSLEMNKDLADGLKWGKPTTDIRVKDLDTALKAGAQPQEKPADAGHVDNTAKTKKKKRI